MSTTDPEARVMKMADGGFRPAFNAHLAVDAQTQLIAAVAITNSGSGMGPMSPMRDNIQQRYATTPDHWLADGRASRCRRPSTSSPSAAPSPCCRPRAAATLTSIGMNIEFAA